VFDHLKRERLAWLEKNCDDAELRVGGLQSPAAHRSASEEETGKALDCSKRTVRRDWVKAQAMPREMLS
jgi:hypothetical protein